jgi:DNA-nicking Smr family endonuclease
MTNSKEEKNQLEQLYKYFPTVEKSILRICFRENKRNFQQTFQEISSQVPASYGSKDVFCKEIPKEKVQKKKTKITKTIDLHGYTVEETRSILKNYLKSLKKDENLLVITGKGIHSQNSKPILKPAIVNYLKNQNVQWKFKVDESSVFISGFYEHYQVVQ